MRTLSLLILALLLSGNEIVSALPALKKPILENNIKKVTTLLKDSTLLEDQDSEGKISIHWAVEAGNETLVQLLIEKGVNINERTRLGATPLHLAARKGEEAVFKVLIAMGADTRLQTQDGLSVIRWAACAGKASLVNQLEQKSVERTAEEDFLLAVHDNNLERARLALEAGAKARAPCPNGITALFIAVQKGSLNMVKFLLGKGSNLKSRLNNGNTLLHEAGSLAVGDFLMQKALDPRERNRLGWYPLHSAASRGNTELAARYLELGAPVNLVNLIRDTPLHLSAEGGHNETVKFLLLKGANPEARNVRGETAEDRARKKGHSKILELLK